MNRYIVTTNRHNGKIVQCRPIDWVAQVTFDECFVLAGTDAEVSCSATSKYRKVYWSCG